MEGQKLTQSSCPGYWGVAAWVAWTPRIEGVEILRIRIGKVLALCRGLVSK
jgi:hypothetical protein